MSGEFLLSLPRRGLIGLVRGYRYFLSPWLGQSCRFYPTCSVYAIEALQRHGAAAGTYLAAARILRCNPYCQGGHDAVPDNAPALFGRLGLGRSAVPSSRTSNPEASS
ncbi:membrane protein insertion efficiency factor YidD [Paucibacter sp. R3-3]|uniref:Putative membrane protein insertion efficiency factor n=1 Tax=Roseateles agri TaxID=3098619 RepID=A0ABU5DRM1_9BURK|nr:membrane protein insertion efficiency factor YidD [Paucibacter sp. R3-3]MDY0748975.1 membrane protein insertion efficiency factor YidD [Paucibacter sp. R3-3]